MQRQRGATARNPRPRAPGCVLLQLLLVALLPLRLLLRRQGLEHLGGRLAHGAEGRDAHRVDLRTLGLDEREDGRHRLLPDLLALLRLLLLLLRGLLRVEGPSRTPGEAEECM